MAHDTMTCDCCGGSLPMRDVWEARRTGAECTGSVDAAGRCRAFGPDAWDLHDMASVLHSHGPRFSGGHVVAAAAQEWLDHDFTPSACDGWCEIGVWDAATAAEFRDAGLTPEEVVAASERLAEEDDQCDPIYAVCNGDLEASAIIGAAE